MANGNYVGRFGDTLRRLTTLDAQKGAFAPQQVGGADTASPFSVAAPGAMEGPQPVAPPQTNVGVAGPAGGFSSGSAEPPDMGEAMDAGDENAVTDPNQPISWQDISGVMPDEHKDELANQVEKSVGGNLKAAYRTIAKQNGITPKQRASRHDMAMFISEVALRFAANRGSSQSNGEALAKGMLQTQDRRTAEAEAEKERQRAQAEVLRREGREDTIRQEGYDRGDTTHTRDRAEKLEDDKRNHEQALELERLRLAAEKARAKGQNVKIVVADDGSYKLIDLDTKAVVPVEEDVTTVTPTKGSRGQGTTGGKPVTTKKPVKALKKPNASGLDQDRVQSLIADRIKELAKNDRNFRKKTPAEQSKIATDLVMGEVNNATNGAVDTGTSNTIDFNDL